MSRPHLTPPETAPELRSAHEPSNPLLGAAEAYGSELGVYPGSSVGSPAVAVDRLDLLLEHCVEACSLGWGPVSPGIVAGARDAKKSAQHRDRVPSLLRLDEPEGFHRVPSSFAKKAAAFFRISLSSRRILFSRLSLLSSSRSSVLSPSRSPRSISACLIQLRRVWSAIPNSYASWRMDLAGEERASWTASAVNSSG